jgi:hypothetical protein
MKKVVCLSSALVVAAAVWFPVATRADSSGANVVDSVTAGDEQSERDHKMQGEETETLRFNDRDYRVAGTNGWFAWDLKVVPDTPQTLSIEFGGERRRPADAVDILVDGTKLATVKLAGGPREECYPLSLDLVKGKTFIVVRLQAEAGSRVGGVAAAVVERIPPPTIASTSKASSTRTNYQFIVNAIHDQREPKTSGDRLKKHFDWWPAKATNQWVQYDFAKPARVSAVEVYWFDDTGIGECRMPKSWRLLYRKDGEWKPVPNPSGYGCEPDRYNRTTFEAVDTDGLRLEAQMPEHFSVGILQWRVE